ncbi:MULTISPECIES: hypothetical protein [Paenibacillus]|uniref:Uncharacterized protein n=1 Tax=Paenibacillus campinasensis TaxID=66347 RepID=A0A268EQS9_9BACL|nr:MULTISPECIES: hypothetical protein [Paenibacillus]MUG65473.1 hypothetical protein [Paenibacillus campinasensis]PAD75478.1 hypothetical protein CHH67_14810 [Paenibacillus campinasensis]PAK51464.1 hypothetical protein CHH75_14825 [Paenibacillus sp. 7541]
MNARIEALEKRLATQQHRDLFLQMKHTLKAIDDLAEHHRVYQAMQALSGVRIIGQEESVFYDTLAKAKEEVVRTLELTVEDLEHKGDKHYSKHFKDGVE